MTICPICNKEKRFIDTVPTILNNNGEYQFYYREGQPGTVVYLCEKCHRQKFNGKEPMEFSCVDVSTWSGGLHEKGRISVTIGTEGTSHFAREFINEDEANKLVRDLEKAIRNINGKP